MSLVDLSPRLTPMRSSMGCGVDGGGLRSAMAFRMAMAHSTALTTLASSTNASSPIILMMRPSRAGNKSPRR